MGRGGCIEIYTDISCKYENSPDHRARTPEFEREGDHHARTHANERTPRSWAVGRRMGRRQGQLARRGQAYAPRRHPHGSAPGPYRRSRPRLRADRAPRGEERRYLAAESRLGLSHVAAFRGRGARALRAARRQARLRAHRRGRTEASDRAERFGSTPWDQDAAYATEFQGLIKSAVQLLAAAKQIGRQGDPSQMERATTAIRATGKELYRILAED